MKKTRKLKNQLAFCAVFHCHVHVVVDYVFRVGNKANVCVCVCLLLLPLGYPAMIIYTNRLSSTGMS